ncbi:MAG: NUDIX hydrolase [Planctomycetia bacterium]|nr:NUDIX hydrolase [Planctomycetia bacterium]
MEHWERLDEKIVFRHPVLCVHCDHYRLRRGDGPETGTRTRKTPGNTVGTTGDVSGDTREGDFLTLEMRNWVVVVAVTPDERFLMVRQYRHGTRSMQLETPGGVIEPGEEPMVAAMRELREETGFTTDLPLRWLTTIDPNPAIQCNHAYLFLAEKCRPLTENEILSMNVRPDPLEDIAVESLTRDELRENIQCGKLRHALILLSLAYYDEWRRLRDGDGTPGLLAPDENRIAPTPE